MASHTPALCQVCPLQGFDACLGASKNRFEVHGNAHQECSILFLGASKTAKRQCSSRGVQTYPFLKQLHVARKRQRLEECGRAKTVEKLIALVSQGQVSVSSAAEVTHCMVGDGFQNEAVRAFSSLGNHGKCPSNYERDFHRWLSNLYEFKLQTYIVPMRLQAYSL